MLSNSILDQHGLYEHAISRESVVGHGRHDMESDVFKSNGVIKGGGRWSGLIEDNNIGYHHADYLQNK